MRALKAPPADLRKYIGSIVMLSFAGIAISRWKLSGELFFLLLAFRDFVASYFLAKREDSSIESGKLVSLIAYASSALPLFYQSGDRGANELSLLIADLLAIWGFLIVTWATIDLGRKMGVSPAKRGNKVTTGLYFYIGHPMYAGYLVAQLGWTIVNPVNVPIYVLSGLLFFLRSKEEEKVLSY